MSYGTHRDVGNVEKRQNQYDVSVWAAARGFAFGTVGSALGLALAQPRVATVRTLPTSIKITTVILSGMACGVANAERAGIAYDHSQFNDSSAQIQRRLQELRDDRWSQLSAYDRTLAWAKFHKFKVVIGSWLGSMGASWLYIQSQPLSFSQKIVQARVWAQGLTLASLLIMAGVTQLPTEADKLMEEESERANHSWRSMIREENGEHHKHVVLRDDNTRSLVDDAEGAAREAAEDAKEKGENVKEAADKAAKEATDVGKDLEKKARSIAQDTKKAAKDVGKDVKDAAEGAEENVKDAAENTKNKLK